METIAEEAASAKGAEVVPCIPNYPAELSGSIRASLKPVSPDEMSSPERPYSSAATGAAPLPSPIDSKRVTSMVLGRLGIRDSGASALHVGPAEQRLMESLPVTACTHQSDGRCSHCVEVESCEQAPAFGVAESDNDSQHGGPAGKAHGLRMKRPAVAQPPARRRFHPRIDDAWNTHDNPPSVLVPEASGNGKDDGPADTTAEGRAKASTSQGRFEAERSALQPPPTRRFRPCLSNTRVRAGSARLNQSSSGHAVQEVDRPAIFSNQTGGGQPVVSNSRGYGSASPKTASEVHLSQRCGHASYMAHHGPPGFSSGDHVKPERGIVGINSPTMSTPDRTRAMRSEQHDGMLMNPSRVFQPCLSNVESPIDPLSAASCPEAQRSREDDEEVIVIDSSSDEEVVVVDEALSGQHVGGISSPATPTLPSSIALAAATAVIPNSYQPSSNRNPVKPSASLSNVMSSWDENATRNVATERDMSMANSMEEQRNQTSCTGRLPAQSIEGSGAGSLSSSMPPQYEGKSEWEDPRGRSAIAVQIAGLELTFCGADLYKEGDKKFDLSSYTRDDDAGLFNDSEWTYEFVILKAVFNGKVLQCVKWKGFECPPTHHSSWIPMPKSAKWRADHPEIVLPEATAPFECICPITPCELSRATQAKHPNGCRATGHHRTSEVDEDDVIDTDSLTSDFCPSEDNGSEDDDVSLCDSDTQFSPQAATRGRGRGRNTQVSRQLSLPRDRVAAWREAGLNVVRCPSKLPAINTDLEADGIPWVLAEQVTTHCPKTAQVYAAQLKPFVPGIGGWAPVVEFDYGDTGFSVAMRKRMKVTNIRGHMPIEEWLEAAKANKLPYLKDALVIRPLKEVIGWEGPFPEWFTALYPRNILTCVMSKALNSPKSLTQLQSEVRDYHEKNKCLPPQLPKSFLDKCKKKSHVIVPDYTSEPRGVPRQLTTAEVEELMGYSRGFIDRYFREKSLATSRQWLGVSFQVNPIMYFLHPLVEKQQRGELPEDGINMASFCTGIGGAEVAANKLQLKINKLITAEIDKDKGTLVHNYVKNEMRGTKHFASGDMTEANPDSVVSWLSGGCEGFLQPDEKIHLVIFGSPCNDISTVNPRHTSILGDKSGVFYSCVLALNHIVNRNKEIIARAKEAELSRLQFEVAELRKKSAMQQER